MRTPRPLLLLPLLLLPPLLVAAAPPPGPVTRGAVLTRAERRFAQADTDRDGYLSRAEYRAAIAAVAKRAAATPTQKGWDRAEAMFDATDPRRTGRIARADFLAGAVAHFDGADLDHNGIVTPDEARKAARIKQKALKARP